MSRIARVLRFSQRRVMNGVAVRAAGLAVRENDAVLILSARFVWGEPGPLDLSELSGLADEQGREYEPGSWGTRFNAPVSWFFIQVPRPRTDARRLRFVVHGLTCVPSPIRPKTLRLSEYAPYTRELWSLPAVRTIHGPWEFDVPLRRPRSRMAS
ncbi:MAG: hypothetical protein EPO26_02590 [Chloroflexota bacterium]|nr:MAG: hypothetical protein EPO26_02590 [Chloroflexota bacterium]